MTADDDDDDDCKKLKENYRKRSVAVEVNKGYSTKY